MIARTDELGAYLQQTVDTESAQLLLDLAESLIVDVVGNLDVWPARVKAVQLEVAARAYRNPSGAQSTSQTLGPETLSVNYGDRNGVSGVYLSAADLKQLKPSSGMGTIRLAAGLG